MAHVLCSLYLRYFHTNISYEYFVAVIILDLSFSADINECEEINGRCEQTCNNTEGSFVCSCDEGFTLSTDGKTCVGKLCHLQR